MCTANIEAVFIRLLFKLVTNFPLFFCQTCNFDTFLKKAKNKQKKFDFKASFLRTDYAPRRMQFLHFIGVGRLFVEPCTFLKSTDVLFIDSLRFRFCEIPWMQGSKMKARVSR